MQVKDLWQYVNGFAHEVGTARAVDDLLNFRREIQVAYTKLNKKAFGFDDESVKKLDLKFVQITELIAKWAQNGYKVYAAKFLIRHNPDLLLNQRKLKNQINNEWTKYLRSKSY